MESVFIKTAYKSDIELSELQNWLGDNITQTVRKHGKFISSQLVIDEDKYIHIIIVLFFI